VLPPWHLQRDQPLFSDSQSAPTTNIAESQDGAALEAGKSIARELAAEQKHVYKGRSPATQAVAIFCGPGFRRR